MLYIIFIYTIYLSIYIYIYMCVCVCVCVCVDDILFIGNDVVMLLVVRM
jgi:hypothetical protein